MKKQAPEYDAIFALLRNALWGVPIEREALAGITEETWKSVHAESLKQTVLGNVFDAVLTLPEDKMPSRDVRMTMLAFVSRMELYNEKAAAVSSDIARLYDDNDIRYFLLKGWAAAAAYPLPEHRMQGDIDFYICGGRSEDAQKLLFGPQADIEADAERHYHGKYKGIEVENHFGLTHSTLPLYSSFQDELYSLMESEEPFVLEMNGYSVRSTGPNFNVLFMLEHATFHLLAGIGLRHLCDWMRQLYFFRDRLDRSFLREIIYKYKFERIANAFLLICIEHLGMDELLAPIDVKRNRKSRGDAEYVLKLIIRGGNFGHHNDLLHASQSHLHLNKTAKKVVSFFVMLRNYRKYRLISPTYFGDTFRDSIKRTLG